ncbi:hypothetical protein [Paraburkholderia antibiotica]|uniref:Uncharacterized protein n=1 Tax=Paraburkholderia antibiotica TaxID=2728839 RepID=A0A7X9ZXX6_9BURK|nr:hypothetical protein [Paraburkholderia antibiotica]NML31060.1 hypothetical protein [Paraburkholderia antibiotica]
MAILVRRILKLCLFAAFFVLSVRYVHTYPLPMPMEQQGILIEISDRLGVADYELLYIIAMTALDLIVTIMLYALTIKLWRMWRRSSAA